MSQQALGVVIVLGVVTTAACSGKAPTAPEPIALAQSQGWLCTTTTAPSLLASCAAAGIASQQGRYTVTAARAGTLMLHATYRDFDYGEYFTPSLTCDGRAQEWIRVSARERLPPPAWFSEHLGANWPAADATYSAAVRATATCGVTIAFDLRSPPYSAFDVTLTLE